MATYNINGDINGDIVVVERVIDRILFVKFLTVDLLTYLFM